MVAKPGQIQYSFNAGELEPGAAGRADIKQYYSAAKTMTNAEPRPQGGFRVLPRSRQAGFVRNYFTVAPGSLVVNSGPISVQTTIAQFSLAATSSIVAADIYYWADISANSIVQVQYFKNGAWNNWGAPMSASPTGRYRRLAVAPGDALPNVTAVRMFMAYAPATGTNITFNVSYFQVFTDTGSPASPAKLFPFTVSTTDAFMAIVSPVSIDIWKGALFVGATPPPFTAAQIPDVKRTQRLETMLLWHRDVPTKRIIRQRPDSEWSLDDAPWTNVADVDYGGSYAKTNDVWTVTITGDTLDYAQFSLSVNNEDTRSIALYPDGGGGVDLPRLAADVTSALEALAEVDPGILVQMNGWSFASGVPKYVIIAITFSGEGNSGERFAVSGRGVVGGVNATCSHIVFGDVAGEPIQSASRGYAQCGVFHEDRLWQGGFRSKPGATLASVTAEYYDQNIELQSAAGAILINIDQDGADEIQHMIGSRFLTIFTGSSEYYVSTRPISRNQPVNIVHSSGYGSTRNITPVESEGSLLYVGRSRAIVYAAAYSDVSQVIESQPISLLASHLVQGVNAAAIQRSSVSTQADRYWMARDNGEASAAILIRGQDVAAFVRWKTDGFVADVSVDGQNRVCMLIYRYINGQSVLSYEILEDGLYLDQARTIVMAAAGNQITGLTPYFNGAMVHAIADGYACGPFFVTGGAITLPFDVPAGASVTIGRWSPPIVETLSPARLVADRTQLKRPVRVYAVRGELNGTQSLAIAANGGPIEDVSMVRLGEMIPPFVDKPIVPRTGPFEKTGMRGFSDAGTVTFTQLWPGAFDVRDITVEART
jgi:hypothetical protein